VLTDNHDASIHTRVEEKDVLTIFFPVAVELTTLIVRVWDSEYKVYTFLQFESTADGINYQSVLPSGTKKQGAFEVHFPARLVKEIRMRGTNTEGNLAIVRFQAFNFSSDRALPTIPNKIF
jgi:hypothetical protein